MVHSESQQIWVVRIGTGLAYLVKTALGGAIGVVFTQLIWMTLRRKAMKIETIDSIFAVQGDLTAFLNRDLLLHAKILAILAAITW